MAQTLIRQGKKVTIAFDLTVGGKLIRSTQLRYIEGDSAIPVGLERSLKGLKVGDRKNVVLSPKQSYGAIDPKLVREIPRSKYATKYHWIGKEIRSGKDNKFLATVRDVRSQTLVLDYNHPFAGQKLHYSVQIMDIQGR